MWDFLKRSQATVTPSPIETAFLQQSKAIERIMAKQQELIAQQQSTLDRIVTAKYDRPIEKFVAPTQSAFPQFGLHDQSEVRPDIEADSDAAFLESVGVK